MLHDRLAEDLYLAICQIPLIDCHSHIDPRCPTARNLEDILGYHYYTELAHSTGMDKELLQAVVEPRERVRAILYYMSNFDNTVQYRWFLEIAHAFLGFQGQRITIADCARLCDDADRLMAQPDWEEHVLTKSNIERVFLTNSFDDPLDGFNADRYVPCLRTDDLVFGLNDPDVRLRLAKATGTEVRDAKSLREALVRIFEHFTRRGAKACAISLPPAFAPRSVADEDSSREIERFVRNKEPEAANDAPAATWSYAVFWILAELCQEFKLPFDLMIGVNRRVYGGGVFQGQDLFDQRTSLTQYARLFNAFPGVTFCVSVLSSGQNQELVGFSWIFPNVVASGHWWYSNIPAYIERDAKARLQAVPKTKQIGYYSDMYKLEFGLPKFNMYRRILAQILADDFIRAAGCHEAQAIEIARLLLRDNSLRIFNL